MTALLNKRNAANALKKGIATTFLIGLLPVFALFSSVFAQKTPSTPIFKSKKDKVGWTYDPASRRFALSDRKGALLINFDFDAPAPYLCPHTPGAQQNHLTLRRVLRLHPKSQHYAHILWHNFWLLSISLPLIISPKF